MHLLYFLLAVRAAQNPCHVDPCYAPKEYDCPMRRLALEYANVTLGKWCTVAYINTHD